jgi:hypothetical protein
MVHRTFLDFLMHEINDGLCVRLGILDNILRILQNSFILQIVFFLFFHISSFPDLVAMSAFKYTLWNEKIKVRDVVTGVQGVPPPMSRECPAPMSEPLHFDKFSPPVIYYYR